MKWRAVNDFLQRPLLFSRRETPPPVAREGEPPHCRHGVRPWGAAGGTGVSPQVFASGSGAESAIGAIEATGELRHGDAADDALLVSDDHLFPTVKLALEQERIVPGRDIGVVTTCSRGSPLTSGAPRWRGAGEHRCDGELASGRDPSKRREPWGSRRSVRRQLRLGLSKLAPRPW